MFFLGVCRNYQEVFTGTFQDLLCNQSYRQWMRQSLHILLLCRHFPTRRSGSQRKELLVDTKSCFLLEECSHFHERTLQSCVESNLNMALPVINALMLLSLPLSLSHSIPIHSHILSSCHVIWRMYIYIHISRIWHGTKCTSIHTSHRYR